jgi:hypothetical protein
MDSSDRTFCPDTVEVPIPPDEVPPVPPVDDWPLGRVQGGRLKVKERRLFRLEGGRLKVKE